MYSVPIYKPTECTYNVHGINRTKIAFMLFKSSSPDVLFSTEFRFLRPKLQKGGHFAIF
jgi:hypothetical protein